MQNKKMDRIKILLLENDKNISFAFKEVVEKEGLFCLEAKNEKEAIEKFSKQKPLVVFIDNTMPDMKSLETLKKIKELNSSVPVIILTGQEYIYSAKQAVKNGALAYLVKPLPLTKIRTTLKRALKSVNS